MRVDVAAATGNRLTLLIALRERLSSAISDPGCPQRDLSSLSLRLIHVTEEIDKLEELIRQQEAEKGRGRRLWSVEDAI